jgi:hypothetical protein
LFSLAGKRCHGMPKPVRGVEAEPVLRSIPKMRKPNAPGHGEEFEPPRGNTNLLPPSRRGETEEEMGIQVLLLAAAVLASIWIIVLWGSRYFGPR